MCLYLNTRGDKMKLLLLVVSVLFSSVVFSDVYKCAENGGTKYQSTPCDKGEIIDLGGDITIQQQQKAKAKLEVELNNRSERRRLHQENRDKERLIRAEESKAYESGQQARQALRANNIEAERLRRKLTSTRRIVH